MKRNIPMTVLCLAILCLAGLLSVYVPIESLTSDPTELASPKSFRVLSFESAVQGKPVEYGELSESAAPIVANELVNPIETVALADFTELSISAAPVKSSTHVIPVAPIVPVTPVKTDTPLELIEPAVPAVLINPTESLADETNHSAAVGHTTGMYDLDIAVKEIIDSLTSLDDPLDERMKAIYKWVSKNCRYKYITVDLTNGYTDQLIRELAEYAVKWRCGSCEHYAALVYVLFDRLSKDTRPIIVAGRRQDSHDLTWGDHAWVIMETKGVYRHYDGLFGRNHMGDTMRAFARIDSEIEATHTWNRDAYPACK